MARPKSSKVKAILRSNMLTILTIVGVLGGTMTGCIIKAAHSEPWSARNLMYLRFPGDIFLSLLKVLIVPLLVASVTSAIGALDLSMSRRIAFRAITYYATTTMCAVILGIVLVVTVRPGVGAQFDVDTTRSYPRNVLTVDTLMDLIRNLFPPNLVQATFEQHRTSLTPPENITDVPITRYEIVSQFEKNTNVLGLVMFSVVFGICLSKMGAKGKPLLDFFETLSAAMMIITKWVIWVSPVGVFFLVTATVLAIKSIEEIVGQLGLYFMTVLLGLFIHGFGTLSILFFVCTRTLPFRFIAGMSQPLATAFSTASSSATMPITIQTMDDMGVDPRVSRFVIPIGATINMDGTALYEAVAAIFIAQIRSVPLSFGNIVGVSITATAASIGAAGIPQAGLVTMVMVLDTVGLPAEDVTLIIAVDWLLDRFRTTINVMCDALGARIVDILSKGELGKADDLEMDKINADPQELVEIAKGAEDTRI